MSTIRRDMSTLWHRMSIIRCSNKLYLYHAMALATSYRNILGEILLYSITHITSNTVI